ncbi:MAG: threonine--tRNA ligase [Polyangiaceae bacterium]|nr:threonine--tRNA ligase [Polyangiaceae bacterium]
MADVQRTPRELLEARGELADDIVAVLIEGAIVDLHTPVAEGAAFEPLRASDPRALSVIRHSAAHVMADAVQRLFPGTQVTIGPSVDSGFYYDFDRPDGPFTDKDLERIEKEMRKIISGKRPFTREEMTHEQVRALFDGMGEKYKCEIIDSIAARGERISVYRHGSPGRKEGTWLDVCAGPHVPHAGHLGAVKLTTVAGAYWRGDERNPMLQRIYGTAFPSQAELDAHLKQLEEAKARDHRKLGKELELTMFHEYAPAMPFFLPRGASVYHRLIQYVRELYVDYGYDEVITPQVFDKKLFETSGHWENYQDNMFLSVTRDAYQDIVAGNPEALAAMQAKGQKEWFESWVESSIRTGLKPMNCPSHCLIFGQRRRSYRELPWRVADFGRLHRYERGGVVHGLARVRTFCQDDAHIFCTPEQMVAEISAFNRLLFEVYNAFAFDKVAIKLALRPEKRVGTDEMWDRAEAALEQVLLEARLPFEKLEGEGAFYGPKLEFHVTDAIGRSWQLGTIQVDYALPERFGLEYIGSDGAAHRPVMLHRAILGSLERFYGVYLEHCAGKFPVWLAPEQVILLTVSERQADYAASVAAELRARGLRVLVDAGADKLGAKIRNARLMRHPYMVVLGDDEAAAHTVAPRSRDAGELGSMSVGEFAERVLGEASPPRLQKAHAAAPREQGPNIST